ncbi:Gfo/Idh/MocA family oxidoreductase [Thiohalocapsa marina]|uniref:Gfo/Idh/MocA family oxidoreductase n=1 Tax=Thiohalocapsa marina TaxID=424902 RepID=A0A5M8FNX4_9GAMM|nr:Gfo/Idh/MocA family oxidoreductase [Thiohalocapsa marina]KAA6184821.1 Gfo/Idh/MocA family oxidoreductase [Thiohalocapsa marina]
MSELITNRRIRIAVVGCGRVAQNHFRAIERHSSSLELCAVCDADSVTLAAHAARHQVAGFGSLAELLTRVQPDLVALCTPSGRHPEEAILAAQHGVHVMTEKPMATRWQDGVRMVKACDEAGVHLFVVKQNRRNATLQLLKRAVEEKRFGRIHLVHLNVFWSRPQAYYDQAKWRGTWEFDGGAFMNQASHYVDLLDWLIGPVEHVQAMVSTTRDIEVEDTGVLNVRWRNGALGSMAVTMLTYPKNLEGSITILGEKGSVRVGGVAVNDIQLWDFAEPRDYDAQIKSANYDTTSVYGFGHPLYYKNVIDVLRGEAEPETDGREGLKSLELLIAAYLSARDGRTVSLPLEF